MTTENPTMSPNMNNTKKLAEQTTGSEAKNITVGLSKFQTADFDMILALAVQREGSPPGASAPPGSRRFDGPSFDLAGFIEKYGIVVARVEEESGKGTTRHLAECPFNPDHKNGDAGLIQFESGAVAFKCFHDSCADREWADVRRLFDPNKSPDDLPTDFDGEFERELSQFERSDRGNGKRFRERHGDKVRYSAELKTYYLWNGGYWAEDRRGYLLELAGQTAEAIKNYEAKTIPPEWDEEQGRETYDERKKHIAFGIKSEEVHECEAMLKAARADGSISVLPEDLDGDPWLYNVLNGTLDLRTGKLMPHDQSHLCTKQVPISYDPDAVCPTWKAFLKRVVPDAELRAYLQRAVGYTLTGIVTGQCFFFLHGFGANGKSTFMGVLMRLISAYHGHADRTVIMQQANKDNEYALAELKGQRLVTVSEVDERDSFDENTIKNMTGGEDPIQARSPYGRPFTYLPEFKLWLCGNHKPRISGSDNGIWRRPKLIPFTESIPVEERDANLKDKLTAELPGILAWAVRGCLAWQKEGGLQDPKVVSDAINEYRDSMDVLKHYLTERVDACPGSQMGSTKLYDDYKEWCQDSGHKPCSHMQLTNRLRDRGYETKHTKTCNVWLNITLKPQP